MLYLLEWAITLWHVFVLSNTNNNTCRLNSTWEADRPPALLFPGGNSCWLHWFLRHSCDVGCITFCGTCPLWSDFCNQASVGIQHILWTGKAVKICRSDHLWMEKTKCLATWSHTFIPGWSPTACAVFGLHIASEMCKTASLDLNP